MEKLSDSEVLRLFGLLLQVTPIEVSGLMDDMCYLSNHGDDFTDDYDGGMYTIGRGNNFQEALLDAIAGYVSHIAVAIEIGTLIHPYHMRISRNGTTRIYLNEWDNRLIWVD